MLITFTYKFPLYIAVCASVRKQYCLFNTAWFIHTLMLIGLIFLTHPPNKRKRISNPVAHRFQEHVVQPGNHNKTLRTGLSLNVPQRTVIMWLCDLITESNLKSQSNFK